VEQATKLFIYWRS